MSMFAKVRRLFHHDNLSISKIQRRVITSSNSAYVPLKFELGDAFQFDWSDEWLMIGNRSSTQIP